MTDEKTVLLGRPPTSGVGILIHKEGKFLAGRRSMTCKRGPGCIALPGGHVENGETIMDAVHREVLEETGLQVCTDLDIEFCPAILGVSDHRPRVNHITYWVYAEYIGGEPVNKEPDKCDGWAWYDLDELIATLDQTGEQSHWTPANVWAELKHRTPSH